MAQTEKPVEDWKELNEAQDWDIEEEEEGGGEEEELLKELSFEVYEPPPPEEKDIGKIIKDAYGFCKRIDFADDLGGENVVTEDVVYRYTLCNANGMTVQIITLGATITAIRMPDNRNVITDITLGLDNLEDYLSDKNNLRFGSAIGRFTGIIYNGKIQLGKNDYTLSTNINGIHHENGGFYGFDKVVWQSHIAYDRVIMTHISPHLDEGYPGDLMVQISFQLTKDNRLIVMTTANTSLPTILSIGHHLYFNMAGHESGPEGLKEHSILVNADKFVKVDSLNLPTGDLVNVGATYFDLRVPRPVWKALTRLPGGGYNHVFCLTKGYPCTSITFACRLVHPESGRYLEVMTNMPGLYLNTGTNLPDPEAIPPLEAQYGFNEELYPEFCREEKMKEKAVKKLQEKMAAKQSWPHPKTLPEGEEIALPIPPEPEMQWTTQQNRSSRKVRYSDKKKKATIDLNTKLSAIDGKNNDENLSRTSRSPKHSLEIKEKTSELSNISNLEEKESKGYDDQQKTLRFLKDIAESDNDEEEVPRWLPPEPVVGRKGALYRINGGICLMTQEFPDSLRFKHFPKPILRPGDIYSRTTIYKFGVIPPKPEPDSEAYL